MLRGTASTVLHRTSARHVLQCKTHAFNSGFPSVSCRSAVSSRSPSLEVLCSKRKKQQQKKHKLQQPKQRVAGSQPIDTRDVSSYRKGVKQRLAEELVLGGLQGGMEGRMAAAMSRLIDSRVPNFHEEFKAALRTAGLGLTQEQGQAVQQAADDAWMSARALPMHLEMVLSDKPDWAIGADNIPLRMGYKMYDSEAMEWFLNGPMGSILLNSRPLQYDVANQNLLSFSNTPAEGVHLLPGSTHVAVGFADLGELAAAVCRWGPAADVASNTSKGQLAAFPLEFDSHAQDWFAMFELITDQETQMVFDRVAAAVEAEKMGLDSSCEDTGIHTAGPAGAVGSNAGTGVKVLRLLQQAHQLNLGITSASQAESAASEPQGLAFRRHVLAAAAGLPGQPLLWVGYDASAYAVAKAAVLVQMMKQDAGDDAVLQVWYSSAWSHTTKAAFMAALSTLLDGTSSSSSSSSSSGTGSCSSSEVVQMLRHWSSNQDVSLATSRREWLGHVSKTNADIGGLTQQADRLAYMRYIFTGELLQADVGSPVMFSLPTSAGAKAKDESFLEGISLAALTQEWNSARLPDVVAAGTAVLLRRIGRLAGLLRAGQVVAQLHHTAVQPTDDAVTSRIAALRPDSMSWSNVADYMVPQDFHHMAQRCSATATLHFIHSMNWIRDVKGASHLDLLVHKFAALDHGDVAAAEGISKAVSAAFQLGSILAYSTFAELGAGELLLSRPVVDNARTIIDLVLQYNCYEDWVAAFLQPAEELARLVTPMQNTASFTSAKPATAAAAAAQRAASGAPSTRSKHKGSATATSLASGALANVVLGEPHYSPFYRVQTTVYVAFLQFGSAN